MFLLENRIFAYFGIYAKRADTNKDGDDKGTLERFNELMGKDIDDNLMPLLVNLTKNLYEPKHMIEGYIPFLESMLGFELGKTLYMGTSADIRRKILPHITKYYNLKGTKRGYELLLGMLGLTITLTEVFGVFGFDSEIGFDDTFRRFDSACPACSDYTLELEGEPAMTSSLIAAIKSVITFLEPINARLREVTYNGDPVTALLPDYNADYNDDFLI